MHAGIVCTTIHEPQFLPPLCANLRLHKHHSACTIWIIPDRKTPASAGFHAQQWRERGFDIRYVSLQQQEEFLRCVPEMARRIPYNSDNRRNVGFLLALAEGVDLLISIDDDNDPRLEHDFIGEHDILGQTTDQVVTSSTGWFNICDLLIVQPPWPIHPRGFPYRARHDQSVRYGTRAESLPIGMNVGLWLDDPDVDAITRNYHPFRVTGWSGRTVHVGPGTWTPINTQNTALIAELIPAYYYVLMNEPIEGLRIDRFGDILSGLFCKKVCDHLGYAVRVGGPICDHRRTEHNLFKDLHEELAGIVLLEELTAWLAEAALSGHDAREAYLSLADALEDALPGFKGYLWEQSARAFFRKVAAAMRVWIGATRTVLHEQALASAAC